MKTEGWRYLAHIKHCFLGKYSYHNDPNRKHSGPAEFERNEKSVTLSDPHADWHSNLVKQQGDAVEIEPKIWIWISMT